MYSAITALHKSTRPHTSPSDMRSTICPKLCYELTASRDRYPTSNMDLVLPGDTDSKQLAYPGSFLISLLGATL